MANILSITINLTASGALQKPIAELISVIALFVPLFLIPYSFKIAGGALGQMHEIASGLAKRAHGGNRVVGSEQNPDSWRNRSSAKVRQRNRAIKSDSRIIGDSLKSCTRARVNGDRTGNRGAPRPAS